MRHQSLLALSLLAFTAGVASAQIDTRGKTQFGLAGFGSVSQDNGFASAQISLTQFVTQRLEIGTDLTVSATMQKTSSLDGFGDATAGTTSTSTTGDVFGRIRYNFVGQSMTVPYISLGAGTSLSNNNNGSQPLELQAGLGFKHFLNERVSFNGEANYTSIQMQNSSSSSVNFLVGLSIYTGGKN